ncbi:ribosome biogenesis GTPase Der [Chlamydiifrater phoenicopteri]|uniref:ribosome biogenesis GTPase Der n=1 Tax=Chlamydiifrater phoenicopteri TaxID=2681469 RepID=UPI001BCDDB45|nr:ribosome biogenesis GTPase Der [Chlamydiifrater phoenicopteri]
MLRIAILGRPNVGKSSLFNRLCNRSLAIVSEEEGTTRDRLVAETKRFDFSTLLIDTGGVDQRSPDKFQKDIAKQAFIAAEEADFILLVTDIRCGITEEDARIAKMLLPLKKPVVLVANKADSKKDEQRLYEFYSLGFQNIVALSAAHGRHMDFLIRTITKLSSPILKEQLIQDDTSGLQKEASETTLSQPMDYESIAPSLDTESIDESQESAFEKLSDLGFDSPIQRSLSPHKKTLVKVALIGRPNVGKSSLINALLNEERCLIDNSPGTTRDNVDILYSHKTGDYLFIDTAGLRKVKSIKNPVEWISSARSEKAIARSEICLLVIDGTLKLSSHDKRILSSIAKAKKPFIILVNKWDMVKEVRMEHYIRDLRASDPYLQEAPILCVSAKTRRNLDKIFAAVQGLYGIATRQIPTSLLNKTLVNTLAKHPPQLIAKRRLRVYYGVQKSFSPPLFLLFINSKSLLTKSYEQYLRNNLRDAFNFHGVPFDIELKEKPKRYN